MFNNERDVEMPALLEFVRERRPHSLLDVGAHYSHAYYAWQLRELVTVYDGIDVVHDPETAEILDVYYTGNVLDFAGANSYDCVVAVSTLEHCGISTYQAGTYLLERDRVFKKCLQLARCSAWFSFPVGRPYFLQGEFANVTFDTLERWLTWAAQHGWRPDARYFYLNDDNQTYRQVTPDVALNHEYDLSRIQQSLCILGLTRENGIQP